MLKHIAFALALLCMPLSLIATTNTDWERINFFAHYADWAIEEMNRTGIPASITLAQAGLESNFGASPLAQHANNFFGIKCKSYWTGATYQHKDDDKNTQGELVHSCFRAYNSIAESFKDHSDFLVTTARYSDLFQYHHENYLDWAIGLQDKGYATAQDYAFKLVDLIERYDLAKYDKKEQHVVEVMPPPVYHLETNYQAGQGYESRYHRQTSTKGNSSNSTIETPKGNQNNAMYYHQKSTYQQSPQHNPITKRLHVIRPSYSYPPIARRE